MSEVLSLYKGVLRTPTSYPTMREIAGEICAEYDITFDALIGQSRRRSESIPRQAFMWRCYQVRRIDGRRRFSTTQIARFLKKRDHVCVVHGIRKHEERLAEESFGYIPDDRKCRSALYGEAA